MEYPLKLKSIKRKTLSDMVVDEIITLLTTGKLKPGDKLPSELELVEMLNVSRSVLREALISLETLGVIERRTKEGTFISHRYAPISFDAITATDINILMETRMAQELGFVTLAAEKITKTELKSLKKSIDAMRNNVDNYDELDKEFHKIIASSGNNHINEGIIEPLMSFFYETYNNIMK